MQILRFVTSGFATLSIATSAWALSPGDLVINEVMANPSAVPDSTGEWVEIFNTTTEPIDLQDLTLEDNFGSHVIAASVVVGARGYAVLGRNANSAVNGGVTVDYQYAGLFLANSGDLVRLLDGATVVSEMSYASGAAGRAKALTCALTDTTDPGSYQNYLSGGPMYGAGDLGTPGAYNALDGDADGDGYGDSCDPCPGDPNGVGEDGLCGNVRPCDLIITEVMPNPTAVFDSRGEWFEVHNTTDEDLNLIGLTIADNFGSHLILSDVEVPAGGYAVLAADGNFGTNGGVAADYDYPYAGNSLALANGGDEVTILNGDTVISTMSYTGAEETPGQSLTVDCPVCDPGDPILGPYSRDAENSYNNADTGTPGAENFTGDPDEDGVCGGDDLCPDTTLPDEPSRRLGVNRWASAEDGVFETVSPRGVGPKRFYTLDDTAGCSCTQIIDELGLGRGHEKFGCSISAMDDWVGMVGE